jgi:hypothetical protein
LRLEAFRLQTIRLSARKKRNRTDEERPEA